MINQVTPTPTPQEEIKNLYAEKGELISQLEIAQYRLQNVNTRLNQMLGINLGQPQPQK